MTPNTETPQSEIPMHVVNLEITNVKRIKAAAITPSDNIVRISGKNDQGKTSVLDCIQYLLGGNSSVCDRPIRDGASVGRIVGDLQRFVVKKTFTSSQSPKLEITYKDGTKVNSPQTFLDDLCADVAFDPLSFVRQKPAEQKATLSKLVGLDFTAIEAERKKLYDERTAKNRDIQNARAKLSGYTFDPTAPKDEVSVNDIMGELEAVQAANREYQQIKDAFAAAKADVVKQEALGEELCDSISKIKDLLKVKEEELKAQVGVIADAEKTVSAYEQKLAARTPQDEAPVRAKISAVDDTNARVRSNKRFNELRSAVTTLQNEADGLTAKIDACESSKVEKLSSAKFPLPGLSFDDSGVLLNGVPFSQGSQAKQLQAAVAIGLALNPRIRVILIRDGSLLDDDSMALLAKMAKDNDAQLWIERVCDDTPGSIVIEDGLVKE